MLTSTINMGRCRNTGGLCFKILSEYLVMWRVAAKFMPCLTDEHMRRHFARRRAVLNFLTLEDGVDSVSKRRYRTTIQRCIISQKSADLCEPWLYFGTVGPWAMITAFRKILLPEFSGSCLWLLREYELRETLKSVKGNMIHRLVPWGVYEICLFTHCYS